LRFFDGIADCMRQLDPSVALLSAVLQYLSHPYEMLNDLMECGIRYIVIDRTPFSDGAADQITVQHVPASIYPASYPCRIFSRKPFIDRFRGKYAVVARFGSVDGAAIAGSREFTFEGVILRKV
jgi:putative methyltransferase (TIGR04325 family)